MASKSNTIPTANTGQYIGCPSFLKACIITTGAIKQNPIPQNIFLTDGTIEDNIAFGIPKEKIDHSKVKIAAKKANILELVESWSDGFETTVGERGMRVSGGQRQRISIARAIIANPRILILDEATSNLDNESESLIQESLKTLMKGRTTFVIAHRLSTIRQADQILVIENGEIAEKGTHEKLLSLEGRYYKLHKYQARI